MPLGLVVYSKEPPPEWDFESYNHDSRKQALAVIVCTLTVTLMCQVYLSFATEPHLPSHLPPNRFSAPLHVAWTSLRPVARPSHDPSHDPSTITRSVYHHTIHSTITLPIYHHTIPSDQELPSMPHSNVTQACTLECNPNSCHNRPTIANISISLNDHHEPPPQAYRGLG